MSATSGPKNPFNVEMKKDKRLRLLIQVLMVMGASLGHSAIAIIAAFPNPAITDLRKDNTTIYGNAMPLSTWQMDLMGSLVAAGTMPGTLLGGWLVAFIGRRTCMMMLAAPYALSWSLVAFAANPTVMLIGRFLSGICYGVTTVAGSTYIIELPDLPIRGALAAIPTIFFGLGLVLTVGCGMIMRWFAIPFVAYAVMLLCCIIMYFLPESPTYLVVAGKEDEAAKILKGLRGPDADIQQEIKSLQDCNEGKADEPVWRLLLQRDVLRLLVISMILFFIQNFSGLNVMYFNTTRIFLASGSTFDENLATILVFLLKLGGTFVAIYYLDRIGRRVCMILSLSIMAACLFTMGTYLHIKGNPAEPNATISSNESTSDLLAQTDAPDAQEGKSNEYLPLVCLTVYMFASCIGAHPVPWIISTEYFPTIIRGQASSLCVMVCSLFNFAVLQLYTPMQEALTMAGLYWFYATVSILGVFFCLVFVNETNQRAVG
ncbi:facilitated trehalose transporter Tret1-like [Macrobrachium nipponense]|uniref:facilitated trehalose transporter Tret1-like n=1 Tax=Macrobrachium nipponense TaxID=159736 RepID=UPI0030C7D1A6